MEVQYAVFLCISASSYHQAQKQIMMLAYFLSHAIDCWLVVIEVEDFGARTGSASSSKSD